MGIKTIILSISLVGAVEFFIYIIFFPPCILYWVIIGALDLAFYFVASMFVFRFLDGPLISLMNRVKRTTLTLKPARMFGLKGELGDILKEVDRLAETLNRERDGLLETYNEYKNIVESLEEGLITVMDTGEILTMNEGAEKIFSTRRSRWKNEKFNDFLRFYGIIFDETKRVILAKKIGKRLLVREVQMELSDKFVTLYVLNDVTEVFNLENALTRSESLALLGKMTASVAHEIKTPVASLKLSVQLLKRQLGDVNPDVSETLEILDKEVRRLEERSKGFLEFSNPHFELKPVNIVDVVKESVKLARIRARDRKIAIDLNIEEKNIPIFGDANTLNSAFLNVLVNGMDACKENGKIEVRVERNSNIVLLTFKDNGIGIPPDSVDYVFEPFFTLKSGGTGLGMSIVKRVINSHGGKVDVKSKEGEGTIVEMRIPISDDENG